MPDDQEAQGTAPHNEGPKEDAVVERLVTNPAEPPNLQILAGLLGKSSRPGHWRLYLNPILNEYVEVPETDVLHSQKIVRGPSRLEYTALWVNQHATLRHTRIVSREVQAQFLQGSIARRHLSRTRMRMPSGPQAQQGGGVATPDTLILCTEICTIIICVTENFCPTEECTDFSCDGVCSWIACPAA
jgi:hypothetical protein